MHLAGASSCSEVFLYLRPFGQPMARFPEAGRRKLHKMICMDCDGRTLDLGVGSHGFVDEELPRDVRSVVRASPWIFDELLVVRVKPLISPRGPP